MFFVSSVLISRLRKLPAMKRTARSDHPKNGTAL
jgi:hypothetical protein